MLGHTIILHGGLPETKHILLHIKTSLQNKLFSTNSIL